MFSNTYASSLQVEEGELTWAATVLIHEATRQVAAEYGSKVVVRYLGM